jgi:hypothetical protein
MDEKALTGLKDSEKKDSLKPKEKLDKKLEAKSPKEIWLAS